MAGESVDVVFEGYDFTNDWFDYNIGAWEKILPRFKISSILEIGSYEGRSACYLIEKCSTENPIEIHCVDTWAGGLEHRSTDMKEVEARFDGNVARAVSRAAHPVEFFKHKGASNIVLAELIAAEKKPMFDLIYIDGSHQAPDVLTDCVLSFQLLNVAGLMIIDDYIWSADSAGRQDLLNMPKMAVDAFVNIFQRKVLIFRGAPIYQLYLTKVAQ